MNSLSLFLLGIYTGIVVSTFVYAIINFRTYFYSWKSSILRAAFFSLFWFIIIPLSLALSKLVNSESDCDEFLDYSDYSDYPDESGHSL